MRRILPALLFFIAFLIIPAEANAQSMVEAVGMSTIHKNFIDIARAKALDEAQRNAVEKSVGVMVSSSSEVENYQLKVDKILSESKGFINKYRIISEAREGETYRVVIEADVGMEKLKDTMEAINLLVIRKARPRIMVMFISTDGKENVTEASVARYFLSKDFKVVDPELIRKELQKESPEGSSPTLESILKAGARNGAEILISGALEDSSSSFSVNGIEMQFNRVIASAKAIRIDTGEVIASDNDLRSGPGMDDMIKRMSDEAGQAVAKKLMSQILDRWSTEITNSMIVKLFATGLASYADLNAFKETLAHEAKGVKELYQRFYGDGKAEFDIEMKGNAHGLADDMSAMRVNGKKVRITQISQNRVEVNIE